jgi:tRNA1(Val) A37 N6-methylase TrmN6
MNNILSFNTLPFIKALKGFFKALDVPMNYIADEPTTAKEILKDTYKENDTFQLMKEVYFVGMVDDAAFEGNKSLEAEKIKSDYDGILIFGITLKDRPNGLLPTRSQLAEISRAFNREFYYTPVVIVFKYGNHLAFANTERLKYKQEWREGEKAGKVSLLRDINIEKPHSGHERILNELQIPSSGKNQVDSFAKLYTYWQEVFNVSVLNKKFYQELSNWYFWAREEVKFPNEPVRIDFETNEKYEEAINEHNGKNVIRLLTRILFVWFIKEKGLIPKEIFDEDFIVKNLIEDFEPQKPQGLFATGKHTSRYYRAILQNLFFATLNCEKGKREFRKDSDHQNVTYLMRYKSYFKNPELFLEIMENKVPFMNGGLFDCLDKVHPDLRGKFGGDIIIYHDGFSDKNTNVVTVPDYLFFDKDEVVDLSKAYGQPKYKNVNTKGLLKILESYKFTITENTPIEEDVALDPELLGRVFENLLASYNPETKTTARKQTGSFYTPREIVNYMVDESLIAYLKNAVPDTLWSLSEKELDDRLHQLMSFDNQVLFEGNHELKKEIIKAIDNCKILDPACGSGAFPMGVLQKMVHVLHKIDPKNEEWQQRQLDRIDEAVDSLEEIQDAEYRNRAIKELKEQKKDIKRAFENNELDYGRKLYLIENCIYGVDIQSIAVQISKLRFFISLIVDQNIDHEQENFGIRPLPNLETKFVAANTLIGTAKPDSQLSFFDNEQVKELEQKIKSLNKKLFSIKSPSRKREIREEMKAIRNKMAKILENDGLDNKTARTLAKWDPFDQNASSPFFDHEWMFDIKGFDVVIGNPPYVSVKGISPDLKKLYSQIFETGKGRFNLFTLFIEKSISILGNNGILTFIIPEGVLSNIEYIHTRKYFLAKGNLNVVSLFTERVFEAAVDTCVISYINNSNNENIKIYQDAKKIIHTISKNDIINSPNNIVPVQAFGTDKNIIKTFMSDSFDFLENIIEIQQGIIYTGQAKEDVFSNEIINSNYKKSLDGRDIKKWKIQWEDKFENKYINYTSKLHRSREERLFLANPKIVFPRRSTTIYCAIDTSSFYALNTAYVALITDNDYKYSYLASWFNSSLINFVYSKLYFGWQITIPSLMTMKIKKPTNEINKVLDILTYWSPEKFDIIIDSIILNLYFSEHMKERGIDVLDFVEKDIESVMQDREFENLIDIEKEQVIEQLNVIWNHPDNEVRNRIKLFAVRSPEILKPIIES